MNATLFDLEPYTVPDLKWISVTRIPTMETLAKYTWGAVYRLDRMDDHEFLLTWKWINVQRWMNRMLIKPRGYVHSRHNHMEIVLIDDVATVNAEFERRGLNRIYGLSIDITQSEMRQNR